MKVKNFHFYTQNFKIKLIQYLLCILQNKKIVLNSLINDMKKNVIYPGTFDPVTCGHIDIIKRSVSIFNKLTVAIFKNPFKNTLFSLKERVFLMRESTKHIKNVNVCCFNELITNFAIKNKSKILVRGIRSTSDFSKERQMEFLNKKITKNNIETIFFFLL
ncbi:hypothetical protein AOQ88_01945 [Candidatus Riesia sp. GBBU]|nr:hypothetical protein AOQ88_01945 [Candidatus Riesia sp. GBBU]